MAYLLGIDNGTTLTKAALFSPEGEEVAVASCKAVLSHPQPGWAERDSESIWQDTCSVVRKVLMGFGTQAADIAAIGTTGFGNGVIVIGPEGTALRPAIASVDTRASKLVAEWKKSGLEAISRQSTFQAVWPGQTAALLAWLRTSEPQVYCKVRAALLIKDYVKYRLTDSLSTDPTDMGGTGLLGLTSGSYERSLLELYGLSDLGAALPIVVPSGEVAGHVSAAAAAQTGLRAGTPVVGGMFDVSATALGVGVLVPGDTCIIAGSWSINEVVTQRPVASSLLFQNAPYLPGTNMAIESSATSASNLEWFIETFCGTEKLEAAAKGSSVYELCNAAVEALPETSVLFHPFLYGASGQPQARAGFNGVGGWHSKNDMLRAVYEGVAFEHRRHIERLRAAGVTLGHARLTGGASHSRVWAQIFADVLEFPLETVAGNEVGAHGAALCAGLGAGIYASYDDAVRRAVHPATRYTPAGSRLPYYRRRYRAYCDLAGALSRSWQARPDQIGAS